MKDTHQNPVQPQEVLLRAQERWLHFASPHRVIQADALAEVIPALRAIEDAVQTNGWHAAGFVSYEASPAFDPVHGTRAKLHWEASSREARNQDPANARHGEFPLLWFGLFPPPRLMDLPKPAGPQRTLSWHPAVDRSTYNAAIARIKEYIAEGQTYQVNYTMRLRSEFHSDPWNFFLHLAQTQNSHAVYVDTGRYAICSASPELFFDLDGEILTSRPMKGTAPRGHTALDDREQAEWLQASEKNRAENVMIVDMIRNDMGRIAKTGSVHVPELFTVEKYPTLWQMTSTVRAKTSASLTQIFTALFPCASITGAPKVNTMRIISELETTPRKVYTGSIGYIAPGRKARFNVAIRTALVDCETKSAEYGVGGGIVWDSTSVDEYAEALLKARVLTERAPSFALLETMLWTPEAGFFLKEKHMARLLESAEYFDFPISEAQWWSHIGAAHPRHVSRSPLPRVILQSYLDDISSQFTAPQRVRLLLDKEGNLLHEARPHQQLVQTPSPVAVSFMKVHLAREPIQSANIFLYHKTTYREMYDAARAPFADCDDILLYNERGELTEFTTGSLVVELEGKLYTPPLACGLLAGTFRTHLLETGQVAERIIRVDELLQACTRVFLVNSVRKWQRALLEKQ